MSDPALELEEFRAAGHRAIDWVASYLAHPERFPVLSRVAPGAIREALPDAAPARAEPLERVLDDLERLILPGVTHWNHPGFLAYFANTGSPPGILGELYAAALNVNGMLWRTSPACTELEEVALAWLRDALGLERSLFGIITDTASMSTFLALAAARHVAVPDAREHGLAGRPGLKPLRLYCSAEAHSSVDKAAIALGIGHANVVKVRTDADFRLDPEALAGHVAADLAAGLQPFAVVATAGTTSTTSIDPVAAIGAIAARHGLWLHVDAAYAGSAAIAPELRFVLDGAERADSIVINPHKWLLTPMDLSVLYTRRPADLKHAFALVPDYLTTTETAVTNLMDYGIQLGRRFRALKLWFILRGYGTEGLAAILREHVRLGHELAARVDAHPDLERLAPAPLSVVCLRARPRDLAGRADEPAVAAYLDWLNGEVIEQVNRTGEVFVSHTRLRGKIAIRIAIGNAGTGEAIVRRAEALVLAAAIEADRTGRAGRGL